MKLQNNGINRDNLPDNLSDEVVDKLVDIAGDAKTGRTKRPNKVTPELCELLKELKEKGLTNKEIMEFTPVNSPDTLYLHLNNDCKHKSGKIRYTDCGWIRFHANRGSTTKELSEQYGVGKFAIRQHATGKCRHDHECEPVTGEQLRENANKQYHTTSVCEECGEEFEHKRYRNRRFCSQSCNGKYAGRQAHK